MDGVTYEVKEMDGVLRCSTCGYEQPIGHIRNYKEGNWPMHCGKQLDWISQQQLDDEKANAPVKPVRKTRQHNPFHDSTLETMQKLYEYIVKFHKKNGYSPSFKEMAEHIWQKDYRGNAHTLVNRLIDAGFLEKRTKGARMIFPVANPPRPYFYKRGKTK